MKESKASKAKLEQILETEGEALVRAAITKARAGDVAALKACLDRLMPPQKERCIKVDLSLVESAADVPKAIGAVVARVAAGELAPSDGSSLVGMLGSMRAAFELVDLQARLEAVEAKLPDATPWRHSSVGGIQ
jgi:hypothetical protein